MASTNQTGTPINHSRRTILRSGLIVAGSVLIAACVPSKSLAPSRPVRSAATPELAPAEPFAVTREHGTPRPLALATPTMRSAATQITTSSSSVSRHFSRTIGAPGREYLAYPEVRGTVQFWHCWDGPRVALVEGLIADMAAIYPSVKVESDLGEAASVRERLVTALASGSPPNAMMLKSDSVAYFADRGAVLPITTMLAQDGIGADWFTRSELMGSTWDGQVYGLPQTTGGAQHLLYVNLDLLEKVGIDPARPIRTWHDLEALVEPAVRAGYQVMDPGRMAVGMTGHQVWTYANGGRYWDGELKKIGWSEPPGVQAAAWLVQFVKAQAGDYLHLMSGGDPRTPLSAVEWAAERYLCCVNGAGWPFRLQQEGQQIRYAIYEVPRNALNPSSHGETPTTGGWTLVIPRTARDHEAAWEWLKLATVSESACAFSERQRRPSPLTGCDEHAQLQATQPSWPTVSDSLARSVPVASSPVQPRLEQIYRLMQDDLLMERLSPADALQGAARDAQQILDDWHASRKRPQPQEGRPR